MTWLVFPLAVYVATRLVGAVFLAVGAARQIALTSDTDGYSVTAATPASPDYWGVMSNWDGQWYKLIATEGYPTQLPMVDGKVAQNTWAFYPTYPALVRLVMEVTGLSFEVAGAVLSTSLGALAVVLLYRLLRQTASQFAARATVMAFCCFVSAPILQVAYTESLAIVLVLLSLSALRGRRYLLIIGLGFAVSLARPITPALALVVLIHTAVLWRRHATLWVLTKGIATSVGLGASAFLWPVIATAVTGIDNAYLLTQSAWPLNRDVADGTWSNWVVPPSGSSTALAGMGVAVFALLVFIVSRRGTALWGLELRLWAVCYPLFVLLTTRPGPSVLRYALVAVVVFWPVPDFPDSSRTDRLFRVAILGGLCAGGLMAQFWWATNVFTIPVSPDRQPLP
jgi:hypothetical protein